jgi:diguanylate cyclase (GGDEF)-like protein
MHTLENHSLPLHEFIVDRVNVGIFVLDEQMQVVLWNRFMEIHSRRKADSVLGQNLFDLFPELPRRRLERKIKNVFLLKNFAFTSWEQTPYLFKFPHNRPVTGGIDCMRQDCTMLPVKNAAGHVQYVCCMLFDVTDTSIYQTMLHEAMGKLQEASDRDGLTGIFNRRCIEKSLMIAWDRAQRHGERLALILTDIDHFKQVNDRYGHPAGDETIRSVCQILASGLRCSDLLGRYGGEEFLMILPQTGVDGATVLAERLRQTVAQTAIACNDLTLKVTLSLGVTELRPDTKTYEQLVHEADKALYASKLAGRNCVHVFTPFNPSPTLAAAVPAPPAA